jgi:hypothetical protein
MSVEVVEMGVGYRVTWDSELGVLRVLVEGVVGQFGLQIR